MKLQIHFKTPDALEYTLNEPGLDEETSEQIAKELKRWIRYDEAVTLVYDTEDKTLTVKEQR